ncbi:MAG: hypothetical protein BGO28_02030 [Alphaproteobacteria bacterium 43-37]|nr:MAG: hypothetical protein BGO28_02030 [Alphaproteobacteria bacterium 43-37]
MGLKFSIMDLLKAKKYTTVTHRSEMNGGFFYTPCQMTCLSIMFRAEGSTRKRHYGHVILTLAHCLKNFPASVYLFSVLHDDGTLSYTNIVRKFAHSQARQDSSDAFDPNDVALAVINPPILDRRPIMIADTALSQFPQKMLTVGFGVTGRGDKDFFIEDRRGRAMESIVREPTDALLKGKAILVEFIRQNPDKLLAGLPHYGDCGAPGIINNQVVGLALHQEELDRHTKKWSQAKNVVLPGQTGAYAHQVPAGS